MIKSQDGNSHCLASLAVFRELYNTQNDIYGIISKFIESIILKYSKHSFSSIEITKILNSEFGFNIPQAVVEPALKRLDFITKKSRLYIVQNLSKINDDNTEKREKHIIQNNSIINALNSYIGNELKRDLTDKEKKEITIEFRAFLLDESNGNNFSTQISAFLIQNQNNQQYIESLNKIKEGIIIYSGLKYNPELNDLGAIKRDITIYIETEILFHLAGFNGEVFKRISIDFFKYVSEINRKSTKHKVYLKYFEQTKMEIERFFNTAESVVEGKSTFDPSKTAMMTIIDGCKQPSDVVEKSVKFFRLLKGHSIFEDNYKKYYTEENHKFIIVNDNIISEIKKNTILIILVR